MSKFQNVASKKIVIAGPSGSLVEIAPGQSVELPDHIARKGFPYLRLMIEGEAPQLLTEAPAPLESVVDEVVKDTVQKSKKTKKKK
jgi:hypothetical protein